MPTIVIGPRPDRTDKAVTVTLAIQTKSSDGKTLVQGMERKLTLRRGTQYVVGPEVLQVLEHSHEGPYLRVLDPHSVEPGAQELPPPPPTEKEQTQIGALVSTFGKKAAQQAPAPA